MTVFYFNNIGELILELFRFPFIPIFYYSKNTCRQIEHYRSLVSSEDFSLKL